MWSRRQILVERITIKVDILIKILSSYNVISLQKSRASEGHVKKWIECLVEYLCKLWTDWTPAIETHYYKSRSEIWRLKWDAVSKRQESESFRRNSAAQFCLREKTKHVWRRQTTKCCLMWWHIISLQNLILYLAIYVPLVFCEISTRKKVQN